MKAGNYSGYFFLVNHARKQVARLTISRGCEAGHLLTRVVHRGKDHLSSYEG